MTWAVMDDPDWPSHGRGELVINPSCILIAQQHQKRYPVAKQTLGWATEWHLRVQRALWQRRGTLRPLALGSHSKRWAFLSHLKCQAPSPLLSPACLLPQKPQRDSCFPEECGRHQPVLMWLWQRRRHRERGSCFDYFWQREKGRGEERRWEGSI